MIDLPKNVSYDTTHDPAYDRMEITVGDWSHAVTVHPTYPVDPPERDDEGTPLVGLKKNATEEEWDGARSEALAFLLRYANEVAP